MNYTEKYHLPQWKKEDRVMMEDFNQMCAGIEEGITRAQGTADAAQETADTARQEASALPYVVGSYTGDDAIEREINVGFRPRFVLICEDQHTYVAQYAGRGMAMAGPNVTSRHIFLTDNGFRLDLNETNNPYPEINRSGTTYDYMAFK